MSVSELQRQLGLPVTGYYDDALKAAVTKWQQEHPTVKLPETKLGVCDKPTYVGILRSRN